MKSEGVKRKATIVISTETDGGEQAELNVSIHLEPPCEDVQESHVCTVVGAILDLLRHGADSAEVTYSGPVH